MEKEHFTQKIKNTYSAGQIEIECPVCNTVSERKKIDATKGVYEKRGDFTLDFLCTNCGYRDVAHVRGRFRIK